MAMLPLSQRQKHVQLAEHAREKDEQLLDVFNCVEKLHSADLRRQLVLEGRVLRIAKIPRADKPPSKVSAEQLLQALPRHIMACLLARQARADARAPPEDGASGSHYEHIARALALLAALSELASSHSRASLVGTVTSAGWVSEVMDAVNLVLLTVAGPDAARCIAAASAQATAAAALGCASMVPAALRALASAFSAAREGAAEPGEFSWEGISEVILGHPRGAVFMEAGFDAVRTTVRAVQAALVGSTEGDQVYDLAFHAGGAMEVVSYLVCCPLFYQRLLMHDPSGAAPARLVLACLQQHDAPLAAPPFRRSAAPSASAGTSRLEATKPPYPTQRGRGSAELLAARGFALLLMLSEHGQPAFLDCISAGPATRALAEQVTNRAAAYVGQVLLRPSIAHFPPAEGEGQMAINTLRAVELLSDDSNIRSGLIPLLAGTVALLLGGERAAFQSRWCVGEEAVEYHMPDFALLVNSVSPASLQAVKQFGFASRTLFNVKGQQQARVRMARHLALERSVLLTKLLVNLHFYAPGRCAPEIEDAFLNRLVHCLRVSARGPAALAAAVDNLAALAGVVLPFSAPRVGAEQELLKEIDTELLADLMNKMRVALGNIPGRAPQQAQQAPGPRPQAPAAAPAQAAAATTPGPLKQEGAQPLQPSPRAPAQLQPQQCQAQHAEQAALMQKQQVLLAQMYAQQQAQQQAAAQQRMHAAVAGPAPAMGVPPGYGAIPGTPAVGIPAAPGGGSGALQPQHWVPPPAAQQPPGGSPPGAAPPPQ